VSDLINAVNAKDLLDPVEFHEFMSGLLDAHGETADQLMVLLVKITTAKAILEDALGLDEPLVAKLHKDEEE
jgi:hypothetical protein